VVCSPRQVGAVVPCVSLGRVLFPLELIVLSTGGRPPDVAGWPKLWPGSRCGKSAAYFDLCFLILLPQEGFGITFVFLVAAVVRCFLPFRLFFEASFLSSIQLAPHPFITSGHVVCCFYFE